MPSFPRPACLMLLSVVAGVFVGACSSVEPFGPSVDLSLDARQSPALPASLRMEVGSGSATLHADATSPVTRTTLRVIGYGEKPVKLTLLGTKSDTLAAVSFPQSFDAGYAYGIGAFVSRSRPIGLCFVITSATPLRSSPGDTLFIASSGIPKGAIC